MFSPPALTNSAGITKTIAARPPYSSETTLSNPWQEGRSSIIFRAPTANLPAGQREGHCTAPQISPQVNPESPHDPPRPLNLPKEAYSHPALGQRTAAKLPERQVKGCFNRNCLQPLSPVCLQPSPCQPEVESCIFSQALCATFCFPPALLHDLSPAASVSDETELLPLQGQNPTVCLAASMFFPQSLAYGRTIPCLSTHDPHEGVFLHNNIPSAASLNE